MKYYVRKITLSKYPKPPAVSYDVLSLKAEAVADIRTFNDGLSIWEIESNSEEAINEAVFDLRNTHRNIVGLTYGSMACVLKIISEITIKALHIRRNGKQVEALIKNNFARINLDSFVDEEIKMKIKKLVGTL